ncbi:MAG: glycosyltransferase family 2 protein [Thermoplasmata archaeon]|nr:MAG: glycosyltransferase family 2 protein [Thermoplasmata archaeon]HEC89939.1 glycosyltransferase family 2 protein [Thermoplasmatales archaeon]
MVKISIILPTINEEKGIGKTIDSINLGYFKQKGWDYEIIVVDGGSKDKTVEIAKKKGAKIIIDKRKGYGRAYKTGLSKVKGDIIVTGDADATYPFDKIHEYIQFLIDEDLDFITTNRFANLKHGSMSLKHRFGNLVLSLLLRILFLINIKDSQSGMWIFRRATLDKIMPLEYFNDGMPFSEEIKIEMFTNKDIKAKEIPSELRVREGEVKLQSFGDGWRNLKFLFKKRVTPRRISP